MSITNGYTTLAAVQDRLNPLGLGTSGSSADNTVIEQMVEQVSRDIDSFCARRFFSSGSTSARYFDIPADRQLDLDDDLLSVTSLTNGDTTAITASDYILLDRNNPPYHAIRLKESSSVVWETDSDGNTESVLTVTGEWGYIDRTDTDARTVQVITSGSAACLAETVRRYKARYGVATEGVTQVTGGGVVITPATMAPEMQQFVATYRRRTP